jgi:hypothetical protein
MAIGDPACMSAANLVPLAMLKDDVLSSSKTASCGGALVANPGSVAARVDRLDGQLDRRRPHPTRIGLPFGRARPLLEKEMTHA